MIYDSLNLLVSRMHFVLGSFAGPNGLFQEAITGENGFLRVSVELLYVPSIRKSVFFAKSSLISISLQIFFNLVNTLPNSRTSGGKKISSSVGEGG